MRQVCHAVDRMGDTRFYLNVRWRSRLCAARAVHVRHPAAIFFPINAPGMGRFKLFDLVGYS